MVPRWTLLLLAMRTKENYVKERSFLYLLNSEEKNRTNNNIIR